MTRSNGFAAILFAAMKPVPFPSFRSFRSFRPRSFARRIAVVLACIAILLNAAAPVLAYAYGDVMHDLGGGHGLQLAHDHRSHDQSAHDHGAHRHAAHDQSAHAGPHTHGPHAQPADSADEQSEPASHCAHCLDFAAGAALGTTPFFALAAGTPRTPFASIVIARYAGRSSLRIAEPRAPPLHA